MTRWSRSNTWTMTMKALFHVSVVYALCACITGCAAPGMSLATIDIATPVSVRSARDAVTIGKSTKAEVSSALGKTTAITFDSGFEVWVYKIEADPRVAARRGERIGKSEFVLLFAPSGIVTKTRIRPAPMPREANGT